MDCFRNYGLPKIYLIYTAVPTIFCHVPQLGSTFLTAVTSRTQSTSP